MASDIQERSAALTLQIITDIYYVARFVFAAHSNGMSVESIYEFKHSDKELVHMWNEFWNLLPDTPEIRQGPFFLLCDLCEEVFDEQDED
jgi:hypothetical protein